jgi:phage RecT family recombinase
LKEWISVANDIVVIENTLMPLKPHFEQVLAGRMPVERLTRTVIMSCERLPQLLECSPQSIMNSAMTAAVLGLEVDGVTGQAFLIPFKNRAQLVIGYKGMNTIAARSGYTVTAAVVREGDEFDYALGTNAFLKHKPQPGNQARIVFAWAVAEAVGFKPVIAVLSIDEILEVKKKSPGARKSDSPWNDPGIGFPAMAEKTARRRLARSMPLNTHTRDYVLAARMEEAFEEQGETSHITPGGDLVIEGTASPIAERQRNETPTMEQLLAPPQADAKDPTMKVIQRDGIIAAEEGMKSLRIWFGDLPRAAQQTVKPFLDSKLKPYAEKRDQEIRDELEHDFLPVKLDEIKAITDSADLDALGQMGVNVLAQHPGLLDRFCAAIIARRDELRAPNTGITVRQDGDKQLSETDF